MGESQRATPDEPSRARVWFGLVLVVVASALLIDAKLWRPGHYIAPAENPQVAEAQSWWSGRLDLTERYWDTALKNGRVYSHFPPLFTAIAATVLTALPGVPHGLIVFGLALPVPILAYFLSLRRTRSAFWATVLALAFVMGTSAWPVLRLAIRSASPYFVNHLLAVLGSLILLLEYFGRRRVWPASIGFVAAVLSRQMTAGLVLPLLYMAWRGPVEQRRWNLTLAGGAVAFAAAVTLGLNIAKFGHPLDSGYLYIYEDRPETQLSRDAHRFGVFSWRFVPRNLYYSNVGLPELHRVQVGDERAGTFVTPNDYGTGIWWTTPLLLWVIVDWRRLWRDPKTRVLLLACTVSAAGLLFFHGTGYVQRGFNRFSLDYLPVLFAVILPSAVATTGRRWISGVMVAWSVLYFAAIVAQPHTRLW